MSEQGSAYPSSHSQDGAHETGVSPSHESEHTQSSDNNEHQPPFFQSGQVDVAQAPSELGGRKSKDDIIALASIRLNNLDLSQVEQNSRVIEGVGYYFWTPIRGGGHFIIGFDGGYITAGTSVSPQRMAEAYTQGQRSE